MYKLHHDLLKPHMHTDAVYDTMWPYAVAVWPVQPNVPRLALCGTHS